jgi:hypothetical protein
MAQTRNETYQAALLLARIDCDTGHHAEELRQARRLMALKPREMVSLTCLERAAKCNRLGPLQQRAARAIEALSTSRVAHPHAAERKVTQ